MSTAAAIARRPLLDERAALLELGPPPANLLTREAVAALRGELAELAPDPALKLIVITGAGSHFSYGASVAEHLPGAVEAMLPEFHRLLRDLDELPLPPVLAAVAGRCLGGGFELALACDLIAVDSDAELGCPEVRLGVFAPAASALLPLRASAGYAVSLLLSGATLAGSEALRRGIADLEAPAGSVLATAEDWARKRLLGHSSAALRQARRAARWPWRDALARVLPGLERQYLGELMRTHDAVEGLEAFVARRTPRWEDR